MKVIQKSRQSIKDNTPFDVKTFPEDNLQPQYWYNNAEQHFTKFRGGSKNLETMQQGEKHTHTNKPNSVI